MQQVQSNCLGMMMPPVEWMGEWSSSDDGVLEVRESVIALDDQFAPQLEYAQYNREWVSAPTTSLCDSLEAAQRQARSMKRRALVTFEEEDYDLE